MRIARTACLLSLCFSLVLFGALRPAGADEILINPDWEIHMTDHGYSDVLFYNAGPFPWVFLHEMISGEWAGAIAYDGLFPPASPIKAMWLEPDFIYPDWTTNSTFFVITPVTAPADTDGDVLPEAHSVISNGTVEIRIDYDMEHAPGGTPMGLDPGGVGGGAAVLSNPYVLKQTYTIKNVSAAPLTSLRFFQFLHGHPANLEAPGVTAVWDPTFYGPAPFDIFDKDVTQFATNGGSPQGNISSCVFEDYINFGAAAFPSDWGLGTYKGHGPRPPFGHHDEVEMDTLGNETFFGPDEVAGSQRWDFVAALMPGSVFVVEVILTVQSFQLNPGLLDLCVNVAAAPDPEIKIGKGICPAAVAAGPYDIITGQLYERGAIKLVNTGATIDLGSVTCEINNLGLDKGTIMVPECSDILFILARRDGILNYGPDSSGLLRFPFAGDCP